MLETAPRSLARTLALVGLAFGSFLGAVNTVRIARINPQLDTSSWLWLGFSLSVVYGLLAALGGGLAGTLPSLLPQRLANRIRQQTRAALEPLRPLFRAWPFLWTLVLLTTPLFQPEPAEQLPFTSPPRPAIEPDPLVLLNIDGAELGVIQPMIEAGELPTFRRFLEKGTWGSLETLEPTLSPILWTTLVTGRGPEDHQIHGFVYQLWPGLDQPLSLQLRLTGLRHRILPFFQHLPGSPSVPTPYTGDLRRSPALWEIIGEHFTVGIYRWLITWPVEEVNGFMVSGGVYAGQDDWHPSARRWLNRQSEDTIDSRRVFPPDAYEGLDLRTQRRRKIPDNVLRRYLSEEEGPESLNRERGPLRVILRELRDPTLDELQALFEKYQPKFTAANFFSVDTFQHRFGNDHLRGGRFEPAVAERYRHTDRQLRRFLASLPPRTNVVVVSDHGFDFEAGHHFEAPPGLFAALGPAFHRGRQVEGLSLFDITPLCLHLLGLPVAEDMPATQSQHYLKTLQPEFLGRFGGTSLPTYGLREEKVAAQEDLDEQLRKELESLGYL